MTRYYIDTDDEALFVRDEEGQELADAEAACALAHWVLPEMVQRTTPDGEHRTFTATVRDESGVILYVATLALTGEWKAPRPAS